MLRQNESKASLGKYLNDPCILWRHKRREMMAIAGTILSAKWLAKIKWRSDVGRRLRKGRVNNALRALKICRKRRMGTSTVLSAIEWRQTSRQPTTSYGDICMPAYKLHKHQRVSSDLSQLIKSIVWIFTSHVVAGGRVWADMQRKIANRKGSRNSKNDLCERARKGTPWFRTDNVLWISFLESEASWHGD